MCLHLNTYWGHLKHMHSPETALLWLDKFICWGFSSKFSGLQSEFCLINIPPCVLPYFQPRLWAHSPRYEYSHCSLWSSSSRAHFSLISYCLKLWIIKMLYKCFMGSSTKIHNHRKTSKTHNAVMERKENTWSNFHYRQFFYLFVCLGTISAQLSTRELHLF